MCTKIETKEPEIKLVNNIQDDVDLQTGTKPTPPNGNISAPDGSGSGGDDLPTKKKKTRRGKPKRRNPNPYMKLSWQQRKSQDERQTNKANKVRAKMIAHGQPLAPYNTTQFLIEDHGYLKDIEERLNISEATKDNKTQPSGQPRTRDSSFSVDSDVDFYSSPEDEAEFLTKEFSETYDDVRSERYTTMTREELIDECKQFENEMNSVRRQLGGIVPNISDPNSDTVYQNGAETHILLANKINEFQLEIKKLVSENDALRRENERLRNRCSVSSMSSSIDSESDSSSSDSSESDSDIEMEIRTSPNCNRLEGTDYTKMNGYAYSPSNTTVNHNDAEIEIDAESSQTPVNGTPTGVQAQSPSQRDLTESDATQ